jgi:hypothetical protein
MIRPEKPLRHRHARNDHSLAANKTEKMNCLNFVQRKKQSRLINAMPLIPVTASWSYPQNLWGILVRVRRM